VDGVADSLQHTHWIPLPQIVTGVPDLERDDKRQKLFDCFFKLFFRSFSVLHRV
jgi:hypothetical protein